MIALMWLIVAVVAFAGELLTLGLFLASFAVSALIVAVISPFVSVPLQIGAFALLSLLLLLGVRPVALRVLPAVGAGNTSPQVGPSEDVGTAVERIDRSHGQIRVGRGEFWSARPADAGIVILPGQEVEITGMDGLTALVRPTELLSTSASSVADDPFGLTTREIEVLQLVYGGLSNAEIAERLYLSPRTVDHHVSHILTKMDADNRVDAVRLAMERGLIRAGQ